LMVRARARIKSSILFSLDRRLAGLTGKVDDFILARALSSSFADLRADQERPGW
jgi:hypothetical protein